VRKPTAAEIEEALERVAEGVKAGKKYRVIAGELGMAESTVTKIRRCRPGTWSAAGEPDPAHRPAGRRL
jgi:hypothetical protein